MAFVPIDPLVNMSLLGGRRIYEEIIATKLASLFSTFIDFSKAFDSVDWNYIENICFPMISQ